MHTYTYIYIILGKSQMRRGMSFLFCLCVYLVISLLTNYHFNSDLSKIMCATLTLIFFEKCEKHLFTEIGHQKHNQRNDFTQVKLVKK